jgi:hypothetical protein
MPKTNSLCSSVVFVFNPLYDSIHDTHPSQADTTQSLKPEQIGFLCTSMNRLHTFVCSKIGTIIPVSIMVMSGGEQAWNFIFMPLKSGQTFQIYHICQDDYYFPKRMFMFAITNWHLSRLTALATRSSQTYFVCYQYIWHRTSTYPFSSETLIKHYISSTVIFLGQCLCYIY